VYACILPSLKERSFFRGQAGRRQRKFYRFTIFLVTGDWCPGVLVTRRTVPIFFKEFSMNASGINIILWVLAGGVIFVIVFLWCHDLNQKLRYILGVIEKMDRENSQLPLPTPHLPQRQAGVPAGKTVSPMVAFGILGLAIFLLFIIPIWWINR
jgi:hypothetical protein